MKELKGGFTTGAAAAAGVKAALIFLSTGKIVTEVEITALDGTVLKIPVKKMSRLVDGQMSSNSLPIYQSTNTANLPITVEVVKNSRRRPRHN